LLSKKGYNDWREIQNEYYEKFKASLVPMTCEELISYFEADYKDGKWPFTRENIISFFEENETILYSDRKLL